MKLSDALLLILLAAIWGSSFIFMRATADVFGPITFSVTGLVFLVWNKVSWNIESWLPILAGVTAALLYGISSTATKKYLSDVSVMTATAGSLFFSAILMLIISLFFLPDFSKVHPIDWVYAITLGILCTAIAFIIYFKLVKNIGPARTASVTFLIPIFAFLWGYILLGELVTIRMWIATAIILLGMGFVTKLIKIPAKASCD